jgi:2-oxoglutarate dehydrogenase E2 component (dihydrolipoamide succinyltransferase)
MAVDIVVPPLGESLTEATVGAWLKKVGDPVAQGEPVLELETDKVNLEVAATEAGVLAEIVHQPGDVVTPGEVLGRVQEGAATVSPAPVAAPAAAAEPPPPEPGPARSAAAPTPVRATPAVRRLAEERGVDLDQVPASGAQGRVRREDVERAAQRPPALAQPAAAPAAEAPSEVGPVERVRMSRRRLTIARRLVEAQKQAAMLTTFNEIDMSAAIDLRRRRRDQFQERHGVRLGFMSFFTKAAVAALKQFPRLNAEIDGDEMVLKHYYNIGIAVAAEGGLVVPVVKNADRLTFWEIEREIARLADKARQNQLSLADLEDGTFTITNGGVFGSLFSTPILNGREVAILGMHAVNERPVAVGGQVEIRPMMYVALSYDHRIVDGAEAVRFLVAIKQLVEDPELLLLEG